MKKPEKLSEELKYKFLDWCYHTQKHIEDYEIANYQHEYGLNFSEWLMEDSEDTTNHIEIFNKLDNKEWANFVDSLLKDLDYAQKILRIALKD